MKHGAVCGTSGKPGSESSLEPFESIRGMLSKCEFRGTEIADRDEISDEITSGEVGSPCPRPGSDLRLRRRRLSRADSAGLGSAGASSLSCMAFNSSGRSRSYSCLLEINEICRRGGEHASSAGRRYAVCACGSLAGSGPCDEPLTFGHVLTWGGDESGIDKERMSLINGRGDIKKKQNERQRRKTVGVGKSPQEREHPIYFFGLSNRPGVCAPPMDPNFPLVCAPPFGQ